jgi:hypothetical protein
LLQRDLIPKAYLLDRFVVGYIHQGPWSQRLKTGADEPLSKHDHGRGRVFCPTVMGFGRPLTSLFFLSALTDSDICLRLKQMDRFRRNRKLQAFSGLTTPLLADLSNHLGIGANTYLEDGR